MEHKLVARLTAFQEEHALTVVLVFAALTVAMGPGMARVDTIVALENMMPGDAEPVEAFNTLRDSGMGKDALAVVVRTGTEDDGAMSVDDPVVRAYIDGLAERMRDVYGITTVMTPRQDPALVDANRDTAVIAASTYMGDDGAKMSRLFDAVQAEASTGRPDGVETEISGVPAVQQRLSGMVARDKNRTTLIALGLVFLITLGLFRGSLSSAVMPLIVVALSVVWLYGTMGYIGLPLSTLAGSVAALVIGIGIDYSIHILNTYRFHRRDNTVGEALSEAVGETGVAIVATSITTISAFMAFLTGAMPEMHRFGLTMSLGIGYALLFSFVLLPAIFVLEERLMQQVHDALRWRV